MCVCLIGTKISRLCRKTAPISEGGGVKKKIKKRTEGGAGKWGMGEASEKISHTGGRREGGREGGTEGVPGALL